MKSASELIQPKFRLALEISRKLEHLEYLLGYKLEMG